MGEGWPGHFCCVFCLFLLVCIYILAVDEHLTPPSQYLPESMFLFQKSYVIHFFRLTGSSPLSELSPASLVSPQVISKQKGRAAARLAQRRPVVPSGDSGRSSGGWKCLCSGHVTRLLFLLRVSREDRALPGPPEGTCQSSGRVHPRPGGWQHLAPLLPDAPETTSLSPTPRAS